MAWNRSSSAPVRAANAKNAALRRKKAFLLGLAVVILCGVAAVILWPSSSENEGEEVETNKGRIKAVTPAVAPKSEPVVDPAAERHARLLKNHHYWDDKIYTDTNGVRRYPGGARYKDPNDVVHKDTRPKRRPRFKRYSTDRIATLLEMMPGEIPVGGMQFPSKFNEDFKASLEEEVEIYEDDSADEIELKKEVAEVKKQLAERMKNGEDPRQICEETWKEMQEIGLYRDELVKQINEIRHNPNMTANDIKDAVDAANLMLKEKGAKGIGISRVALRRLAERDRKKRSAEK